MILKINIIFGAQLGVLELIVLCFVIQHIKTKLEEDMRTTQSESGAVAESDLARRNAERRLFGSLGTQSDRIRQEMQRYASMRDPTLR